MIHEYVIKLIENLPDKIKNVKNPIKIDLVLDGGIFNGSYLVGALYFLKEMEKRKYIDIERISGCSVGSIVAFLYFMDRLDYMPKLYEIINTSFKQHYNLQIVKDLKTLLKNNIPDDICRIVNNKFYITYNNIKQKKKRVKYLYKNSDDILNTIIKSCFIPFLIDGNLLFNNQYMDGMNPYIFKQQPNKKILYLDLFGYDKIGNLLNIKNEKSNYHRILSGLLDIHSFFIKQSNTQMSSYVNEWNIINRGYYYCKLLIEKICIYVIYLIMFFQKYISKDVQKTLLYKIISKITQDIFIILLENYCL
jgi:hypothetical protein